MKIIIGTAQFGMDYGISNKLGQTKFKEVENILNFSYFKGINTFDTAPSYGNSEKILSKIIKQDYDKNYNIISKIPKINPEIDVEKQIRKYFEQTKKYFGSFFKTYLVHDATDFIVNKNLRLFLNDLKSTNRIEKIGVSVYNEEEINLIMEIGGIDVLQVPINVLDHRLIKSGVLDKIKKKNIEIYARSVFLQGLFFLEKKEIYSKFPTSIDSFEELSQIARKNSLTIPELALLFTYNMSEIDKIILGINDLQQLESNINILSKEYDSKISEEIFERLNFTDINVLNPILWDF